MLNVLGWPASRSRLVAFPIPFSVGWLLRGGSVFLGVFYVWSVVAPFVGTLLVMGVFWVAGCGLTFGACSVNRITCA